MVKENHKTYTIWKLDWPEILKGEETYGLARELTTNLREVDQREIMAFTDDVEREVQESIDWSYELQYATTKDGRIIAIWGVQPKRNDEGLRTHALIWCLGTDLIKRYAVSFAKESGPSCRSGPSDTAHSTTWWAHSTTTPSAGSSG